MSNWLYDKKLIEETEPEAKEWLSRYMPLRILKAGYIDDRDYNTDLIVPGTRIALRGRWVYSRETGENQFVLYGHQFTIRDDRPMSGLPTEIHKILAGHGDWFFYYWVDNQTKRIVCATLIDLHLLRPQLQDFPHSKQYNKNPDGRGPDSCFRALDILAVAARTGAVIDHRHADEPMEKTWRPRQIIRLCTWRKPSAAE